MQKENIMDYDTVALDEEKMSWSSLTRPNCRERLRSSV